MTTSKDSPERMGIILVDHGSRFPAANDMLHDVAAIFQKISGCAIVEPAHMELAPPSIMQAFDACVRQGVTRVVVHPYFLAPGRHSTTDIPRLVREAAAAHPGVAFHVTPPLGRERKIVEVILQRVQQCAANNYDCENCTCDSCAAVGRTPPAPIPEHNA